MSVSRHIEGRARRLSIYIGESDRWGSQALSTALLETLQMEGLAGATLLRGAAGFGAHSQIHTAAILRLSEDLPLLIEVVDTPEKIAHAIEIVSPMVREGLITVEELQIVKYTQRHLNPLPADRLVSEVMTKDVLTLFPDTPIAAAWSEMLEHVRKALPVIDHDRRVIGMLTDEDLLIQAGIKSRLAVAQRLDAALLKEEFDTLGKSKRTVADLMSRPAVTIRLTDTLGAAVAVMIANGYKRLPVVDDEGKIVGVLSRVDILRQVVEAAPEEPPAQAALVSPARLVGEVMNPKVPIVKQTADLPGMISKMVEFNTRRLIVVDESGRPTGLVSDGDLVARVKPVERRGVLQAIVRLGRPPASQLTAAELMSPGVLTADRDMEVVEAVRRMLEDRRKWMVVVDQQGRAIGLLDRQILLQAVSGQSLLIDRT